MRPAGAILAPGEEIIATGICFSCIYVSLYCLIRVLFIIGLDDYVVTVCFYVLLNSLVFKFVEPPENNEKPMEQKSGVKFKIMSLKMKVPTDYMPELFEEQKDHVSEEQVMRVVFLDPENPNSVSPSASSSFSGSYRHHL